MGWGEDIDEELKQRKEFKVGFLLSFKSMILAISHIRDITTSWDDKHPRDDLRTIWTGAMLMLFVFLCFTYNILACATLPFIGFYSYVLFKIAGAYRQFQYSLSRYWIFTILMLIAEVALSYGLRTLIGF